MNIRLSQKKRYNSLLVIFAVFISLLYSCQMSDKDIIDNWQDNQKLLGNLSVTYPANNTVFPPEIIAPTFVWKDEIDGVERWLVSISCNEK